jgi:hypothetical protein
VLLAWLDVSLPAMERSTPEVAHKVCLYSSAAVFLPVPASICKPKVRGLVRPQTNFRTRPFGPLFERTVSGLTVLWSLAACRT